jgi:hypothetical protein
MEIGDDSLSYHPFPMLKFGNEKAMVSIKVIGSVQYRSLDAA